MTRAVGPVVAKPLAETEMAADSVPTPRTAAAAVGPVPGLVRPRAPQATLVVGGSTDPAEREADAVAASVVSYLRRRATADSGAPERDLRRDTEQPQRVPMDVLRAAAGPDADFTTPLLRAPVLGLSRRIQLLRDLGQPRIGAAGGELDRDMQQAITDAGPGRELRRDVRAPFESAMGGDLSAVRVHTGPVAERLNRQMSARAFTVGADVYFRDGLPDTRTEQGQHLLAHELAHTLQQGSVSRTIGRAGSVRRLYDERAYDVSSMKRKMFVELHPINWGAARNAAAYAASKSAARPRAFLFETITTIDNIDRILGRYRGLNCPWDVGLTVVLNGAWTPAKKYTDKGEVTTKKATLGADNITLQKALTKKAKEILGAWNGPPLQIVTATWERRERADADGLEAVQGFVPYTSLRAVAATNAGALTLETALSSIHDHVWHKMGDDDMPMPEPNPVIATPEHLGLAEAESNPGILDKTTLVTFGYDLTTAGTVAPITGILKGIYSKEMELRDRIQELGAPIYPSEPTTFYRSTKPGEVSGMWQHAENQKVGGSGQQLEGAKLIRSLQERRAGEGGQAKGPGYQVLARHTVQVETSAGRRNDLIVALLNGWWATGMGDPFDVREKLLLDEINKLDQCALKEGEYLKKVYSNLKGDIDNTVFLKIAPLVAEYQQQAVTAACSELRRQLYAHQRAAHLGKKLLGV